MSKRNYVILTLLLNGIIPWGLYVLLSKHMSGLAALSIATLIPLAENLIQLLKHRKLDAFGSLMLFTFVFSIVLVAMGGSEKLLLIRESFITGAVGLIFLGSLLFPRPIMFYLASRFVGGVDFEQNWKYAYFRKIMRLMSFVWGIMLSLEAIVRTVLVFELSTAQFLAISNVVMYGFIGAAVAWTVVYRKHSSKRLIEIKRNAA
ncbi:VC0807 family protein [Paenibacillus hexagrammi]|uniref:Intracellular septation protein A n=1 Tax=Paenibacillus hexagrammi TaxID=2908839 RepID=A0ABY3SJ03_9BACL|nr:VC0807 family protein [Paenibacillus sp. YPD9-1]UJF33911.1 hypothetical protein L0M14_01235 [Paenibacillus sp. YPD9-1]